MRATTALPSHQPLKGARKGVNVRQTRSSLLVLSQGSSAWNSAGWNWGYANGTAHDVAARTRRMLATPSQRKAWLEDTMGGRTEIGEVEITLALAWQKVARERRGGDPQSWRILMEEMASGRFESGTEGSQLLAAELAKRIPLISHDLQGYEELCQRGDDIAQQATTVKPPEVMELYRNSVQVLCGLQFVESGL
eukprot:jgi/Tetstr1/433630/TSEL_022895.t1